MDDLPFAGLFEGVERRVASVGRPWVTLSYAQSLDGSLAGQSRRPLGLSGAESMRMTHRLRAANDAILVGIGTVLADDPHLTVRLVDGPQPFPVVLDSRLRTPLGCNLLAHPRQPWIATGDGCESEHAYALQAAGARLLRLPLDEQGEVSLTALLEELCRQGVKRLMVEGGAGVLTSFLGQRLADAAVITLAPVFVGGITAVNQFLGRTDEARTGFPHLENMGSAWFGQDLVVWGRLV